jgi:uncharacterized protein YraI
MMSRLDHGGGRRPYVIEPSDLSCREAVMLNIIATLFSFAILILSAVQPAHTEHRVALVIGNKEYGTLGKLTNAFNDASGMTAALQSLGFKVTVKIDLDQRQFDSEVSEFIAQIKATPTPDTVALVYFAGHGLQVAGVNYLVPVKALLRAESDIPDQTISVDDIVARLEASGAGTRLIILDACRNNPFRNLLVTPTGFAQMKGSRGTLIAYSTAPGKVALDGPGQHSPFTDALLKWIQAPGLSTTDMLAKVRIEVGKATNYDQIPWVSESFTSAFYFVPTASPRLSPDKSDPVGLRLADDPEIAYFQVISANTTAAYLDFIRRFPGDNRIVQIRAIWRTLADNEAFERAKQGNTAAAYVKYLSEFPDGIYKIEAQRRHAAMTSMPSLQPVMPNYQSMPPEPRTSDDCGHPHGTFRVVDAVRSERRTSHSQCPRALCMRACAGVHCQVVGQIPAEGTGIALGHCRNVDGASWCEARWQCSSGWVNARFLIDQRTPPPDSAGRATYRVVNVASWDVLYIRSGPGPGNDERGRIPPNTGEISIGRCEVPPQGIYRWCQVDFQGVRGWVSSRFLADERTGSRP